MDPRIWSRLPHDVLGIVIEHTKDATTLDYWCLATRNEWRLHTIALRTKWQDTVFDDEDLVPQRGDDGEAMSTMTRRAVRKGICRKQDSGLIRAAVRRNAQGIVPATFIVSISFNFLFHFLVQVFQKEQADDYDETCRTRDIAERLIPSGESLDHSLAVLGPHLVNVRSVRTFGTVPQSILDLIVNVPSKKVYTVVIRKGYAIRSFWYTRPSGRREQLDLTKLSSLETLQNLEIWKIRHDEAAGLAQTMPKLKMLGRLVLGTGCGVGTGDPMTILLCTLFPKETHMKDQDTKGDGSMAFPSTLKHLSLIDSTFTTGLASKLEAKLPFFADIQLEEIRIDIDNVNTVSRLLDMFPRHRLAAISVPSGCRSTRAYTYHPDLYEILNHIIGGSKDGRTPITLLNAWNSRPDLTHLLNQNSLKTYSLQELVLGTKDPRHYELTHGPYLLKSFRENLYGHYKSPEYATRWGSALRRLRIDDLDWLDLDLSALSHDTCKRIKILMLGAQHMAQSAKEPFRDDHATREWQLANAVSSYAPALRVIVIGSHWYWLDRHNVAGSPLIRIWLFQQAQEDQEQRAKMIEALSDRDWSFLTDESVPRFNEYPNMEWRGPWSAEPGHEMFSMWNYIVLLPIEDEILKE